MKALIDNDVLLKAACYRLLTELTSTICSRTAAVGVLGSARFVITKRIPRLNLNRDREVILGLLSEFLKKATVLEPDEEELSLAAHMELAAQEQGVFLDGGESLLCAILVQRAVPLLATGDKRAIAAVEALIDTHPSFKVLCGRVKCLEQLFLAGLDRYSFATLRTAVCAEPSVDRSLTICFACRSPSVRGSAVAEGLQSYITDLRSNASRVLAL